MIILLDICSKQKLQDHGMHVLTSYKRENELRKALWH